MTASTERSGPPVDVEEPSERPQARLAGAAARGFLWTLLSFGSNKAVVFVTTLVLARLLTPADFGLVAGGLAVLAYLEVALDLGVGSTLIYEQQTGVTDRVRTAFTVNLVVAAALTALAVAAAPAVAGLLRTPGAADLYRTLALSLLFRGVGQVQSALLRRDLAFRRRTIVDIARAAVRAGVSVPLALSGFGAWALVWGVLAGEATSSVLAWRLTRFRPALTLDRDALRPLLGFGLTVLATRLISELASNSDYVIVGRRLGPAQLGYYSVAWRLPELLIESVLWVFSSVAFPVYAKARTHGPQVFRSAMLRSLRLVALFSFPVGVGLAIIARDAVLVLFSSRWLPSAPVMAMIALTLAIVSVGYASGDLFPALGRPGLLLKLDASLAVPIIAAIWFAAPHGIVVVAAVHLAAVLVYAPVRLTIASRVVGVGMRDSLAALWPGLCLSLGVTAGALPLRQLLAPGPGALAAGVAGGVLGAAIALLVGAPRAVDDVRALVGAIRDR